MPSMFHKVKLAVKDVKIRNHTYRCHVTNLISGLKAYILPKKRFTLQDYRNSAVFRKNS